MDIWRDQWYAERKEDFMRKGGMAWKPDDSRGFCSLSVENRIKMCIRDSNKTLAAQLYGEFKEFFPNNAVEYFVSYYDYYQPEAYVP